MKSPPFASVSAKAWPSYWSHREHMTEELQAEPREERQIYDPIGETPTSYLRDPPEAHPPLDYPPYKSTSLRHPKQPLVYLPQMVTEITGPQLGPVLLRLGDRHLP